VSFQTICSHARAHPSKPAVVHDGKTISYAGFAGAIGDMLSHLKTQELAAGQTVVVIVHNLLDCWVAILSLQALGLNTVCARSISVIESLGLENVAGTVTTERETPKHQLEPDAITGNRVIAVPNPVYSCNELSEFPKFKVSEETGGHTLYTSGTTGNYKKIFISADLIQKFSAERTESGDYNPDTIYYCVNFALWTGAGYKAPPAVWHGEGCAIFDQRENWYDYFHKTKITNGILIPDMVDQVLNSLNEKPSSSPPGDFELLLTAGFISPNRIEKLINHVTTNLVIGYGSTELKTIVLQSRTRDSDDLHWLSCTAGRTVEIVDKAGNVCPINQEGQLRVLLGELDSYSYVDDPVATNEVFRAGYFYPGDMAVRRADGRIRILGRSADVINLHGQKLAVAPMEQKIQDLLGVKAVCLFSGLSDAGENEVVIAIESKHSPEKSDLDYLGHEFEKFDQIRFALVFPFPRTQTGTSKINRVALRKLIFPTR